MKCPFCSKGEQGIKHDNGVPIQLKCGMCDGTGKRKERTTTKNMRARFREMDTEIFEDLIREYDLWGM